METVLLLLRGGAGADTPDSVTAVGQPALSLPSTSVMEARTKTLAAQCPSVLKPCVGRQDDSGVSVVTGTATVAGRATVGNAGPSVPPFSPPLSGAKLFPW